MRLTLLTRCLERGGAERQMVLLALGLRQRGHEVSVLSFYAGGDLKPELERGGVPVWCPGKRDRWDVLGFGQRFLTILRRLSPQVVYSFLDTPNLAAAWLKPWLRGAKVVWGLRASDMDLSRYGDFARLAHQALPWSAWGADLIIANSQAGARHHQAQGLPAVKMVVVPNGIDTERFVPDPAAGQAWRQRWGLAPEQPLLGLAARLDPMKDLPTFLRAGALLRQTRPEARLVSVGGGAPEYAAQLRGLADSLGLGAHMIWAGEQADMPGIMNALDLCLLTSAFGEGFPNVLGEAMACGRPCLVTDVGDAAWVLGRPEWVAAIGDAPGLARRAGEILALEPERRAGLGQELRRRVRENFSLTAMVEATERVLLGLLPGQGR